MEEKPIAELYLSFAAMFHRPDPQFADHLEEVIDLWQEQIPVAKTSIEELYQFSVDYPAGEQRLNALWEHYIPLFETGAVEASPYASVYLNEGLVMGKEAIAVKKFYEASGYMIGENIGELPDHLAIELEFCALLARDGEFGRLKEFKQNHLLPFLKNILPRIKETGRPVFSGVAEILEMWNLTLMREGDGIG